ncbi:membrane-associated lipoprotein [Candidatus Scalindua japonica]|uniref:FAD:protein FMN transferase n=1 Tax=Candidatus Scalindua japonica TaxID=1284222 RepID=A0A286TXQ3_9BACT|nr:FAD:protein FMN transferase [Candidatus Scalindua japonica]GAX60662.1 membrane-associated lipoprotein [Candidatus Scalindua japonica]
MKPHSIQNTKTISRRTFLALSGSLSLSLAALTIPLPSEAAKFNRHLFRVSTSRLAMGTVVTMIVVHESRAQSEEAMGLAFAEVERLSSIMSRHKSDSHISQLNADGALTDVPPEVMEVLRSSIHYHAITQGTFDITVKPIVDLYKKSFAEKGVPPTPEVLRETLDRVGTGHVMLSQKAVSFARSSMGVTLDGIAKGYIIDRAMSVLRQQGIQHAFVNGGGDIAAYGGKGGNKPWQIAIQDPWRDDQYKEVLTLQSGAIATSGNYEVYFDQEKLFHHLVSPIAGLPARETASVSIRARNAMEADALATAVFVMGPLMGSEFIKRTSGIEGFIIDKSGAELRSDDWKGCLVG